jgi:hypothetical protein
MKKIRIAILVIGVLLPFLGIAMIGDIGHVRIRGIVLAMIAQAILWFPLILSTFTYRHPMSCLFPTVFGYGFILYAYTMNMLYPDAQGGLVFLFGPIYALVLATVGWVLGLAFDRFILKR